MTPDNNEWAGLGDELAESERTQPDSPPDSTGDDPPTDDAQPTDTAPETDASDDDSTAETSTMDESGPTATTGDRPLAERLDTPAFAYDECQQSGLHPRKEQWQTYDVGRAMARSILAEHGLTSVKKRELDDAVLRLANNHHEELARLVIDARGIDLDDIHE